MAVKATKKKRRMEQPGFNNKKCLPTKTIFNKKHMEGHVSAPILGTPAWYAQRDVEFLVRLARQPQAVVQLWLRKVRIQSIANAQRHAGKQAMLSLIHISEPTRPT